MIVNKDEQGSPTAAKSIVKIDFTVLQNLHTSSNSILKFIKTRINNAVNPQMPIETTDVSRESGEGVNPYPRIFTSYKAFLFFEKLQEEFGNTEQNLADYSYVYYKMLGDKLLFPKLRQTEYFDLLSNYDIGIDRIKPFNAIGKISYRDSIYDSLK